MEIEKYLNYVSNVTAMNKKDKEYHDKFIKSFEMYDDEENILFLGTKTITFPKFKGAKILDYNMWLERHKKIIVKRG